MTALEACDKIQEAIDGLHEETRTSGWDWSFTKAQSDEAHNADNRETLAKTRKHFKLEADTSAWFVSANGTDAILAICGNSPTAEARARYISWVNPQNIQLMIARIAALESQLTTITAERDAMLNSGAAANTALTIAQLEAENAAYAAERERLCAPVIISECEKHGLFGAWDYRHEVVECVQNLLNARLTAPAQEAQKEKE